MFQNHTSIFCLLSTYNGVPLIIWFDQLIGKKHLAEQAFLECVPRKRGTWPPGLSTRQSYVKAQQQGQTPVLDRDLGCVQPCLPKPSPPCSVGKTGKPLAPCSCKISASSILQQVMFSHTPRPWQTVTPSRRLLGAWKFFCTQGWGNWPD